MRVGLGEILEGVQRAEPDRGLRVAELLDDPGVKLVDLLSLLRLVGVILFNPIVGMLTSTELVASILLNTVLAEGSVGDDRAAGLT